MTTSTQESSVRCRRASQRGNAVFLLVGAMVVWFLFFTVKDWITESKDSRDERLRAQSQKKEVHYMPGDIYHNPYEDR